MEQPRTVCVICLLVVSVHFVLTGCSRQLSEEEKQLASSLRSELQALQASIKKAEAEDAALSGGLVKALVAVRLEILRTNEALIQQRINAIEGGGKVSIVTIVSSANPQRASELEKEIAVQRANVAGAREKAALYSGGLVAAMTAATVATAEQTLAMTEQQYLIAKYGLALPSPGQRKESAAASTAVTEKTEPEISAQNCLKIETFDGSVLSVNDSFTELAWKADVKNSCGDPFQINVRFAVQDKDEFELDDDSETIIVPANGIGKARGKMLISPTEKARRISRYGVRLSAQ